MLETILKIVAVLAAAGLFAWLWRAFVRRTEILAYLSQASVYLKDAGEWVPKRIETHFSMPAPRPKNKPAPPTDRLSAARTLGARACVEDAVELVEELHAAMVNTKVKILSDETYDKSYGYRISQIKGQFSEACLQALGPCAIFIISIRRKHIERAVGKRFDLPPEK